MIIIKLNRLLLVAMHVPA